MPPVPFILLFLACLAGAVTLDYDFGFEEGVFPAGLVGSGNTPTVSNLFAREGKYSMRSYVHRFDSIVSFRTEAVIKGEAKFLKFEQDYWYGFR